MLMRTDPFRDPFRDFERLTQQLFGNSAPGTWSRPNPMPMDAYRSGDEFIVSFDLPGVTPDAIDLDVERNVLTVKAERRPMVVSEDAQMQIAERPLGVFSRQLFLGDTLDADRIEAGYENGVLTLRIPVAEQAKPLKITVSGAESDQKQLSS
jgi:HSP20 family protein